MEEAPQNVACGLNSLFDAISQVQVLEVQKDGMFHHLCDGNVNVDRAARVWIAERFLAKEIARRKLTLLNSDVQKPRPAPYALPAIADVPVDSDHLVPLSAFQYDGSRLLRNGFAFCVLTTTSSPNSSYWLLGNLYTKELDIRASVRLDPFLFGPADQFPALFYRMWQYGRPLDWERLGHLRQQEHGRWLTGSLSRETEFTDFCWTPRPDGIHLLVEEVPKAESCTHEPSRYLHAIYNAKSEAIEHFDVALRVFTPDEIGHRRSLHVRRGGKLGIRQKVCRVDQPIHRDALSVLAQAFFVWNEDVRGYFTQEVAPPLSC